MLSIKTVWWLQHIVRQFQSTHPFSWQDIVVWRSYIVVHHRVQSHIQNSLLGLLVFNRVRWWHEIDKGPIYSFWGKADSQHRGSEIVCAAHVKPLFAEHSHSRCWSKTHVLFVPDPVQERIETCTCFFCFLPSFPTAIYFSASWGKEDSRESCPHRPCRWLLRLQVPMLSGTRTTASTLGIQQMLMPACVMLVRNQIEMAQ